MKLSTPLVSVAIITYNQKAFLKECIESILTQEYENIEIVVADDNSTDGTQEMLAEYAIKYKNKFVLKLSTKNLGITANSNAAHFACKGKYVAWMGGDDLMLPGKIKKQVEYMEKNPECNICYHNLDVFQSETNKTIYYKNEKYHYEGDVHTLIKYGTFNGACSNMVRRSNSPVGGFNKLIPVASDWLYWIECLHNGGTIDYIPEVLGRYRRHKHNVTNNALELKQNDIDHLNSLNLILLLNSNYLDSVMFRYSRNLSAFGTNRKLPYFSAIFYSIKIRPSFKNIYRLALFLVSFGTLKK